MNPAPLKNILDRLSVAWHERALALKAVSFAIVGVVNSAIDFGVFWTFGLLLRRRAHGAGQCAVLAGGGVRLLCDELHHHLRAPSPAACCAFGATISAFVASGVRRHGRQHGDGVVPVMFCQHSAWAAKLVSIAVSFVVNFSLSHFVVFKAREAVICHSGRAKRGPGSSTPCPLDRLRRTRSPLSRGRHLCVTAPLPAWRRADCRARTRSRDRPPPPLRRRARAGSW